MSKIFILVIATVLLLGGCSTKEPKQENMVAVQDETLINCSDFSGRGNNNADGVHMDSIRTTYSDCSHIFGTPSVYPFPTNQE